MKTIISSIFLLVASLSYSQALQGINWMSFEQVEEAMKTQKKKIFIDLYTDWCGWCKRMDATTFKDPAIVEYMNRNFYCIKFNAETRDTVRFNNFDFYDLTPDGKKGTNYLAYSLLEGRMSYPSFAVLDENFNRLYVIAGYKQPEPLYGLLLLFATNEYQNYNNFLFQQLQKQQEAQNQQGQ